MHAIVKQRSDYTFKYNKKLGRHGWLRLTPAYSVKLVTELIQHVPPDSFILDPFSGTATTGLVAAENNLRSHLYEINPFLIWLGNAKCSNYSKRTIKDATKGISEAIHLLRDYVEEENWIPPIYQIEKWWSPHTLRLLAALRRGLAEVFGEPGEKKTGDLPWIAFCRLAIETSSAAFNHVSMSFHETVTEYEIHHIEETFLEVLSAILESASVSIDGNATVIHMDSRYPQRQDDVIYTHVVTSPPYSNRISYIRELRPYMYWTKYLTEAKQAGEMDWGAIGGTWGVATSRLLDWSPKIEKLPPAVYKTCEDIRKTKSKNADLLSIYVMKYFHDMHQHFEGLRDVLAPEAELHYIVGNSTFYGVGVHTEQLLGASMEQCGLKDISIKIVRKRNSKKELFEYCVSGKHTRRK